MGGELVDDVVCQEGWGFAVDLPEASAGDAVVEGVFGAVDGAGDGFADAGTGAGAVVSAR